MSLIFRRHLFFLPLLVRDIVHIYEMIVYVNIMK